MSNTTLAEAFIPVRASDRTERAAILGKIAELERQHQRAASKVCDGDTQYVRTLRQREQALAAARDKLRLFDDRVAARERSAGSKDARAAGNAFAEQLKTWESCLQILAADTRQLLAAADAYATASGEKDSGRYPHRHMVTRAIISRAHHVLNGSGLRFDQFAPGAAVDSLVERWLKS